MLASLLDFNYVRSLFSYSESEGVVYWLPRENEPNWNSKNAGKAAGYKITSGYIQIGLKINDRRFYIKRSRFIVSIHNNGWIDEDLVVDHINRDPIDDRFINLRVCNQGNNSKNKKLYANNTSGFKGVSLSKAGTWVAQIQVDNVPIVIGYYNSKEDAALAYDKHAVLNFGEFASTNRSMGLLK